MRIDTTPLRDGAQRNVEREDEEDVSPGYRHTQVGAIPIDWSLPTVGDLFVCMRTASNSRNDLDGTSDIAYIHYGDIHTKWSHFVDFTVADLPRLSRSIAAIATPLRDGDLVVADASEDEVGIGKSVEIKGLGGRRAISGLHTILLRAKNNRTAEGYRGYLLESFAAKVQLRQIATGLKVFGVSKKALRDVLLPLPPSNEQKAIAETLSDVDGLLSALEALIAKKRAITQAAMQQLLTGKTRLPGFNGEWKTKRLGRHVTFLRHGTHARADLTADAPVRYLHYGDVHTTKEVLLRPRETSMPRLEVGGAAGLDRLQDGDLVLVDASEDIKGVGKSVELTAVGDVEVVSGLHTIAARFDKSVLADGFKAYLQFCPAFRQQVARLAAGTKVYATSRAHIAGVELSLPPTDEQSAIATVLSDMNSEIAGLEARRDKTRAIKQGMMQQLLYGRIRLVKPNAAPSDGVTEQGHLRHANVYFVRSVIAAEIVDQLHEQPTFGHVKFQKMMFLVDRLCDVDTGSTYRRKAAGPYDNRALRSIDSQLRRQKWFDARKEGERYRYVPMQKRGGHKLYFERYFSEVRATFDRVLGAFKTMETEKCEIVATLLAAWSDLLRAGGPVSDQLIVHEVLNNWHEAKRRISEDRWLKALDWMRRQGFVPKGTT